VLAYGPDGVLRAKWGAGGGDGSAGGGSAGFLHPAALAADAAGDVYVADTGNERIVKLSSAGAVLDEWGSQGSGDGHFQSPNGVALDAAGAVYVLDSANNRVQVFDPGGRFLARWGARGAQLGELSQPGAIAVDCTGAVYVADTNNNRVERFQGAAAGSGCVAGALWPPPLDVAPVVSIGVTRTSGILARRALALSVSCERGCKILVTATLAPLGSARGVALIGAARGLAPKLAGHVRLRVGPAGLRRLRRALGRKRRLWARVRIVAAGPTGRRVSVTRAYLLRR
jgi:hypothetical protein